MERGEGRLLWGKFSHSFSGPKFLLIFVGWLII